MLQTSFYPTQTASWPQTGQHILAQFDAETIIVYQAYKPSIARYAIEHGCFGGEFSFSRMSWIKTNFLWMMYRSGWGTKANQEITLGLRIRKPFFDSLLAAAVPSSWVPELYPIQAQWAEAVSQSSVRLQWDPDHGPKGEKLERRAIQIGLRGQILHQFATMELVETIDLTDFVREQREILKGEGVAKLMTPQEEVYSPADRAVARHIHISA